MCTDLYKLVCHNVLLQPLPGSNTYLIQETEKDGEINLYVEVTGKYLQVKFCNNDFALLKNRCCTDGILWENLGNRHYRLHLFEMKKTIKVKSWEKAKQQYHGALVRWQMIAGLFGASIDSHVYLYTVYCENKLSLDSSNNTDLAMVRTSMDGPPEETEWKRKNHGCDLISPYGWLSPHWGILEFQHTPIQLKKTNATGIPEDTYNLENQSLIP